jgi:serine/threonine protein kinase
VSEECKDLIKNCLIKDYKNRFTAKDCLSHNWIISKSEQALQTGVVGDSGNLSNVIQGIDEVLNQSKIKNAALQYLS